MHMKLPRMDVVRLLAAALLWSLAAAIRADGSSDTRAAYLKLIDRPLVAAKAELDDMPAVSGLRKYHLWFWSDASERVPGYVLLPDAAQFKGRRPVVIALHGTGGNKDNGQIAEIVLKAARAGFIGVAIDGRFHASARAPGRAPRSTTPRSRRHSAAGRGTRCTTTPPGM